MKCRAFPYAAAERAARPLLSRRAWLAATLPATLALAAPGSFAAAAAAAPVLQLAPLPVRERRLANGLQVVSIADDASATVSIQLWFRVGGKDDPAGRSGFAHLFEHLMFKGTRYLPPESFDRFTEDVGGRNNAFTAEDMTVFYEDVPANHLERLLWAEAERLAHLNVDEANFKSERAVVEEEFRMRVLADPYGLLFNALPEQGFEAHPYKRPVIGSIADLEAATLDDVRAFHATYYRPDNAVLIVAGRFDPAQLDGWVDRYFGPLTHPDTPIPRVNVREPKRQRDKRVVLHGPNVPLPAVALIWQGPPAASEDGPALQVASELLSTGESARLNEALVYRAQTAQAAGFSVDLYADAGLITAYAIAAGKHSLAELERGLMQEVARLAGGALPAAELDKVRTRLLTAAITGRQTPNGKASAVGEAIVLHGDARYADRELGLLQAVTAADVQRVLKRYVLQGKRVTVQYTQGEKK